MERSALRSTGRLLPVLLFLVSTLATGSVSGQNWMISGQVLDFQGTGLENVDIDLLDGLGVEVVLSGDFTGPDGTFTATVVGVIPAGLYLVQINPPPGAPFFPATVENVFIGGNVDIGVVILDPGAFVSGRVVDEQGVPLPEVDLDFIDSSETLFPASGDVSDLTGNFEVLVPPDFYTVNFSPTAATPGGPYVSTSLHEVPAIASVDLGDVVVAIGYVVTGTLVRPGGSPVIGADLDVLDPETGEALLLNGDSSGPTGAFNVLVPQGSWIFEFDPPIGELLVTQLLPTTVLPAPALNDLGVIELPAGVLVEGVTVDGSQVPVPEVDLDFVITATQLEIAVAHDNAGPTGSFDVVVLPDIYDIIFRPPFSTGLAPLTLASVDTSTGVNLRNVELPSGFAITGTVTTGPLPFADVEVTLTDSATGDPVYTFGNETDFFGDYGIRQVSGVYDVTFTPPPGSGLAPITETDIVVTADTVVNVDFGAPGPLFIRGDANFDGNFDGLIDGVYLLNFGFVPLSPAPPCPDAADADDDGTINPLVDGYIILAFQFIPGSIPVAPPYPDPGVDPTPDTLGCP